MARGMSLDEFRDALSSDARVENEKLKADIDKLKKESSDKIKELEEELDKYKRFTRVLGNRCFVFTEGLLCLNCQVEGCDHDFTEKELDEAVRYMEKNKMPLTDDTRKRVNDFLMMKRKQRESKAKNK